LSSSVEAFRFFGANLGLFEDHNSINSLIVTSAVSGEGKSTVVLNLAKATAAIGSRVLVVDVDLRSLSKLTTSMALTSNQGLSDLLLSDDLNAHLVTGLGKLQALKLKEAINQLNISKTPILGVLINKITAKV
jgi:Mrp family chromosome partitioning ATPase